MAKDFYAALGVTKTATQDEIKNAYRKLAKKLHPDLNPGNKQIEQKFKEVAEAYDVLGDPQKRVEYDRLGEAFEGGAAAGAGPHAWRPGGFYYETQGEGRGRYSQAFDEDILRSIFEQFGGGSSRRRARGRSPFEPEDFSSQAGPDEHYRMEVDFRDAALGTERELTLPTGRRLRVKIPAGVETGTKLRFAGLGSQGVGGGRPGDAYVEINVIASPVFHRAGKDVEVELPVSFAEAILGGEARVPTLDGHVAVKIPPGISSGARLRIRGKGIVDRATGMRGDQYAVIKVMVPAEIDSELRQAVQEWSERHPFNPRDREKGGSSHAA